MFSAKIKNFALDCVFPTYCLGCGRFLKSEAKTHLCPDCRNKIPINSGLLCPICFRRVAGADSHCRHSDKKSSLNFLAVATAYENPLIQKLIHQYKYGLSKEIKWTLAEIITTYLTKLTEINFADWIVVAVPLHPQRLKWRGFNQSEELAKILSQKISIPLNNQCLLRQKKTASQVEIKDFQKRRDNLSGAFQLKKSEIIKNKNIILLDDVHTSGATMEAAAAALKLAGVKTIIGLAIAK